MRLRPFLALAVSTVVVSAVLVGGPAQAAQAASGDPVVPRVSSVAAARALAHAQAALDGESHRDATLALRDLRRERAGLSAADRASADQLLARPRTGRSKCFTTVCVHWSTSGDNAATAAYVQEVADVAQHVLKVYARAGYRAPESDGTRGGNGLLDIYLKNLGAQGLYGYCSSDRTPPADGPYDTWAYCAFDNDYQEFPDHTPRENLEVTAAHELFHAVQFAYDYDEDRWFMEATAVWAEDELYTDVNDNLQYLPWSPLAQPARSMDHFQTYGLKQYGDWIFFRYLTEQHPAAEGGLPTLIRRMWERADGSKGAEDDYSIQAVAKTLAARGTSLRAEFASFADANRRPGTSYEEGAANNYPKAPLSGTVALSGSQRDSGWKTRRVDHLASATLRFTREPKMNARRLELRLDLPPTSRGSGAVATVYRTSGRPQTIPLSLSEKGDGTRTVGFGKDVKWVEVTLANAGIDYKCWRRTGYSCQGRPLDNDLPLKVRATALR